MKLLALAAATLFPISVAAQPFCTTNFYTYQDQPIESFELTCTNQGEGLTLRHAVRYDAAALFAKNGRCSDAHFASVSLRTTRTNPFELFRDTTKDSSGRRGFEAYRGDGLKPGELLVNLVWLQDGQSYRLGVDERGATPKKVFSAVEQPEDGRGPVVLRARALPFSYSGNEVVNGAKVEYKSLPVDCELKVYLSDWYGR